MRWVCGRGRWELGQEESRDGRLWILKGEESGQHSRTEGTMWEFQRQTVRFVGGQRV